MSLISVILPVYNTDDSYVNAVKSVLNQTYSDFELIIVDDGSPRPLNIGIDKRIKLYKRDIASGGASFPRNLGLEYANGKFVAFIDSDDEYHPTFLERMYSAISKVDLCFFNYSWGANSNFKIRHNDASQLIEVTDLNVFLLENMRRFPGSVWNCLFRKEIIDELSLRFVDNKELFAEDFYFTISYLKRCKYVEFLSENLYRYYIRKGSVCDKYMPNDEIQIGRYFRIFEKLYDIFNPELTCVMFIKAYAYCRSKTSLSDYELMQKIYNLEFLHKIFKKMECIDGAYVKKYWGCLDIPVNKIGISLSNYDLTNAINVINEIIK